MRSNIDVLVSTGLGPRAEYDFQLARITCVALRKLGKIHKVNFSKFAISLFQFNIYTINVRLRFRTSYNNSSALQIEQFSNDCRK